MNGFTRGIWDTADQSLQWLGKGAIWLLLRRQYATDDGDLYAATGGALVCAAFGGIVGFAFSGPSQNIGVIDGTILGGLLGVCIGMLFGSFVEVVDASMKDILRYLNSK